MMSRTETRMETGEKTTGGPAASSCEAEGTIATPIGLLTIRADANGISAIEFPPGDSDGTLPAHEVFDGRDRDRAAPPAGAGKGRPETPNAPKGSADNGAAGAHVRECIRQLSEYFEGKRTRFDLPLSPAGTEFEKAVWGALVAIPCGETRTYGEIARAIGLGPAAARAVGGANGRNPVAIVVPCHRVIGSGGSLTGFGGGLARKQWLLEHESGQRRLTPR
jgi:methylated-DNA-[protein]-cysteine S-methyltransferase